MLAMVIATLINSTVANASQCMGADPWYAIDFDAKPLKPLPVGWALKKNPSHGKYDYPSWYLSEKKEKTLIPISLDQSFSGELNVWADHRPNPLTIPENKKFNFQVAITGDNGQVISNIPFEGRIKWTEAKNYDPIAGEKNKKKCNMGGPGMLEDALPVGTCSPLPWFNVDIEFQIAKDLLPTGVSIQKKKTESNGAVWYELFNSSDKPILTRNFNSRIINGIHYGSYSKLADAWVQDTDHPDSVVLEFQQGFTPEGEFGKPRPQNVKIPEPTEIEKILYYVDDVRKEWPWVRLQNAVDFPKAYRPIRLKGRLPYSLNPKYKPCSNK